MKYYKDFEYYRRCKKCDKVFRNYEEADRCPFCKETKHVFNFFSEDKNENNKS